MDNSAEAHKVGLIREIYDSRNILKSLIIKSLFGRYKNSVFGFAWHFFNPILMMLVYYIVFTEIRVVSIPNFWIYLASGLFPFNFMLNCMTAGSTCITSNPGMVKKMYIPREILVLAQAISSFIIMLIGYSVIVVAIVLSGNSLSFVLLLMPLLMVIMLVFVIGYMLLFSAIAVYLRDVQYLLNSISMIFFFATPMYFTLDSVGGILETIVMANPFTYYVEFFHQIVYYNSIPSTFVIVVCFLLSIISIMVGLFVFGKLKKGFAEKDIQVVVAIKCLDEGMNIPGIKTAFILASSSNPKEYIQRRGRVLRKAEGKEYAEIYDFITIPFDINGSKPPIISRYDQNLVKKELNRVYEFKKVASNGSKCNELIDKLKEFYELNTLSFEGEEDLL